MEPSAPAEAATRQLVQHGVLGEGGVVGFNIEFEIIQQAVFAEEIEAGGGVGIVLVRRGLARLGLDVELAVEADAFFVINGQVQQAREVIQLALHVRVQQGGVTFAAAPEDVALATQLVRGIQGGLDLGGGVGEDVGIG